VNAQDFHPPSWSSTPRRIVSLVPSITESLFELGLADQVVGVTDWCVHPAAGVARLPKLGGTKDPDLAAIAKLAPDLVIANREENTERAVRKLRELGLSVWLSYPRTVAEGAALLEQLALRLEAPEAGRALCRRVSASVEEAIASAPERAARRRVFCPIWRDPWMTIGRDSYIHDLIELCGGINVFADSSERRYPQVTQDDIVAAQPEVVLLPDEPYAFGEGDASEFRALDIPAAASESVHLIDGTLVSWYGPRISKAIRVLRSLFSQ
jgi:ABC-type Fe3+-hydroxamate transport system substrate-binding protein